MSYKIVLFGSLPVPKYITQGDSQNLGTGMALTSFLQLPGDGWYDNYRDRKSPQGIRPISKSGLFWGTDAELRAEMQAWRAMLGVRARLTIEWDDGTLMWQTARLQNVDTPRPSNAKGGWLSVTFTWITAAQNWRGVTNEDWTWGDESWAWGDGSAGFSIGTQTFALTSINQAVTITHNGNIDATNVILRLNLTGTWQDVTIINETTGQQIVVDRPSSVASPWLEIDTGAMSLLVGGSNSAAINRISRSQNTLNMLTVAAHNFTSGSIRITGTDIYDGDYYPASVIDTDELTASLSPRSRSYGTVATGVAQELFERYSLATFSDKEQWMVLAPGDNIIRVIWSIFPTTASLTAEFVDHYG